MRVVVAMVKSLLHGLWAILHLRSCCEQTITLRMPGKVFPRIVYIGCTCGKELYLHPGFPREQAEKLLKE